MNGFVSLILGLAILLQLLLSQAALAGDFTVDVSILLHGLRVHPGEKARLEGVLFVAGDPQTITFTGTNLDPGIIVSFGNTSIDLPQRDHNELHIIVDGDSVAAGSHSVEVTATGGCTSTGCTGPTHTVTVDLLVNVLIVRPPVYVPLPPRFHPK
jgi:archaellum component FlaG (FlaF/FlaG flagellin family)